MEQTHSTKVGRSVYLEGEEGGWRGQGVKEDRQSVITVMLVWTKYTCMYTAWHA